MTINNSETTVWLEKEGGGEIKLGFYGEKTSLYPGLRAEVVYKTDIYNYAHIGGLYKYPYDELVSVKPLEFPGAKEREKDEKSGASAKR